MGHRLAVAPTVQAGAIGRRPRSGGSRKEIAVAQAGRRRETRGKQRRRQKSGAVKKKIRDKEEKVIRSILDYK